MDNIDTLFSKVTKKIQDSSLVNISSDSKKHQRFIDITREVADFCMKQTPQPTIDEYRRKVVDTSYNEFIRDIQGAPLGQKEPPFKEPTPGQDTYHSKIISDPQLPMEKQYKFYQPTQPSQGFGAGGKPEKRTIIIDTGENDGTTRVAQGFITSSDATENDLINFSADLNNELKLDSDYEVYLESMTACGTVAGAHDGSSTQVVQTNEQYFNIKIEELDIPTFSNNGDLSGSLLIPNDKGSNGIIAAGTKDNHVFKSKKFNYISTLKSKTINQFTFKVTLADGITKIFHGDVNTNRIIFEFTFIPVKK